MQNDPVQLSEVIYNAAEQSFEALVTVHRDGRMRRYACAINAPITTTFEEAANGIKQQAIRRDAGSASLSSEIRPHAAQQRAGRRRFDPRSWLDSIISLPGSRAA